MKYNQGKVMGILAVVLVSFCSMLFAQQPGEANPVSLDMISFPVQQAPKVNTLNMSIPSGDLGASMRNTRVVHPHGTSVGELDFAKAKAEANRLKNEAMGSSNGSADKTSGTQAASPTVGNKFFGNLFDGTPNDNTVAVGRNGYVCSATNSRLYVFKTTGGGNTSLNTLASFYSSSNLIYDPKLVFDRQWNRFILVYLNGDNSATSRVVICFSETDDPNGNWNVYTVPGNPAAGTFGSTWADFPQIGINGKELFITVNLFSNSNNSVGAYVYQVNKVDGYTNASTLSWKGWGKTGNDVFAMFPAQGCSQFYSPQMYMVSSLSGPFGATSTFFLHEITDTLTSSSVQFKTYTVTGNLTYSVSPDAAQKGSNQDLDTRDCRVRGCMYENGKIYFGMNSRVNNKSGIYVGVMDGVEVGSFASVKGYHIGSDSLEYGFPGFTCGGCLSADGTDNSALIFYNITSPNHFPGTGVSFLDSAGSLSATTICKEGAAPIAMGGGGPSRWGDYAQISGVPDNPGEGYGAGYYGYGSSGSHGTYISQVYSPCAPVVGIEEGITPDPQEFKLFPNPTQDIVKMTFSVPQTRFYTAELYSLQGEKLRNLLNRELFEGDAELSFDTQFLQSGIYLVKVSHENGNVFTKKLVVTH